MWNGTTESTKHSIRSWLTELNFKEIVNCLVKSIKRRLLLKQTHVLFRSDSLNAGDVFLQSLYTLLQLLIGNIYDTQVSESCPFLIISEQNRNCTERNKTVAADSAYLFTLLCRRFQTSNLQRQRNEKTAIKPGMKWDGTVTSCNHNIVDHSNETSNFLEEMLCTRLMKGPTLGVLTIRLEELD